MQRPGGHAQHPLSYPKNIRQNRRRVRTQGPDPAASPQSQLQCNPVTDPLFLSLSQACTPLPHGAGGEKRVLVSHPSAHPPLWIDCGTPEEARCSALPSSWAPPSSSPAPNLPKAFINLQVPKKSPDAGGGTPARSDPAGPGRPSGFELRAVALPLTNPLFGPGYSPPPWPLRTTVSGSIL